MFTDIHHMKSQLKCVFFKILKSNGSLHVVGRTFCVCWKVQQQLSQPFINLKRQAATEIVYGPERKISSKDKEIEISCEKGWEAWFKALVPAHRRLSSSPQGGFWFLSWSSVSTSPKGADWPHTEKLFVRSNKVLVLGFQHIDKAVLIVITWPLSLWCWSLMFCDFSTPHHTA